MAYSQNEIILKVGDNTLTAFTADNEAATALLELLKSGPLTIRMSDYGGFEKVGELPQSLPASNSSITTEPGDIMLYQGDKIVIFYGTNTWSYTRLGKIEGVNAESLKSFLGEGDIDLTLSSLPSTGMEECDAVGNNPLEIYDLMGNRLTEMPERSGVYIVNGKKRKL